jgi:uncharacterized protein YcbK (DUF882 family)
MRRHFLTCGAAALALAFVGRPARADLPRSLTVRHAGTGARFAGPWHDGTRPDPVAMQELSEVLADQGATPARPFAAETLEILWELKLRTRVGPEIVISSGFRTPRVNRAAHGAGDSQHLRAAALDVDVPAGRLPAFAEAALRLGRGGVGLYPRRGFVHIDSGPVRSWRDGGAATQQEDRIARMAEAWRAVTLPAR